MRKQIRFERRHVVPAFDDFDSHALKTILRTLIRCVRQDYEFCICPTTLQQDVIDCLVALRHLDEKLLELGLPAAETLVSYSSGDEAVDAAANPFPALVRGWISEQRQRFDEFLRRCVSMEDAVSWKPVHDTARHSASVVDLFTLFADTVEFFGKMVS